MFEFLEYTIKYLGLSNILAIILFLISVFIAFYFYYKTFYRLVYSTARICKGCSKVTDWTDNETEFVTRILFYNCGRKTISRKEIQKLELKSSRMIGSIKMLIGSEIIRTTKKKNTLNIDIEYMDSSEFFILEVNHSGTLEVNGRISETGKLLNTEPKYWLIFNVAFTLFSLVMIFNYVPIISEKEDPQTFKLITTFFILFSIYSVMRFIHSILFIPDRLSSKYLDTKDKFAKEFKNY